MVAIAAGEDGKPPSTICSDAAHARAGPRNYSTSQLLTPAAYQALGATDVTSYWDMITQLVNNFAIANSGKGASVDLKGETSWWKSNFNSLSPIASATDAGASDVVMRNDSYTYKQTYRKFTCAYNDYSTQDCRLDGQAITSNTVTDTHTQTYTYSQRVGFVAKVKGATCVRAHVAV